MHEQPPVGGQVARQLEALADHERQARLDARVLANGVGALPAERGVGQPQDRQGHGERARVSRRAASAHGLIIPHPHGGATRARRASPPPTPPLPAPVLQLRQASWHRHPARGPRARSLCGRTFLLRGAVAVDAERDESVGAAGAAELGDRQGAAVGLPEPLVAEQEAPPDLALGVEGVVEVAGQGLDLRAAAGAGGVAEQLEGALAGLQRPPGQPDAAGEGLTRGGVAAARDPLAGEAEPRPAGGGSPAVAAEKLDGAALAAAFQVMRPSLAASARVTSSRRSSERPPRVCHTPVQLQ